MLKSDRWIRKMSQEQDMINPFSEKQVREGVISYGLSSYGYDLRVADEFKIFTNVNSTIVDPKHFDEKSFVTVQTDICLIPPNSFALARSVEVGSCDLPVSSCSETSSRSSPPAPSRAGSCTPV